MPEELKIDCVRNALQELGNDLVGEILTIIDAIVMEKSRQGASKSLVKQAIWRRINEVGDQLSSLAKLQSEVKDGKTDES